MARLGMGLGIRLDIKRDDTLPLVMGGNKVRQLEFYLGAAAAMKADTVLITGAVQSNFVRLCAAGARKLGMMPVVQLEDRVPKDDIFYNSSGNVLLLKMLGAEIVHFSEGENEAAADANLDRLAQELREKGRNPYVVHLGIDHPPIGGLGYAAAACELHRQYHAAGSLPDSIVIPSGSGLTHAGFLAGARAIGWQVPVWGVCVRRDAGQQHQRVLRRVREIAGMLGHGDKLRDSDVKVDDTCLAPGYGRLNDHVAEAMRLAAHKEAILTDPVYSGRTLAGLIHLARSGAIQPGQRVTFIHTGGTPAIFGYQYDLGSAS
ncbi:MAG: D-cysteine desulfhydrase family protein [Rhodobacteraceae bacterium]|nr:D-cysteine desulfhydrase family protein [Paracoccaceae bacterium]